MERTNQFAGRSYLNLETYRRNGQAMPTPVWFVDDGGAFYVRTLHNAGKVKRVRNNAQVRVMPCGRSGEPLGDWVSATASVVEDEATVRRVDALLNRKYGLIKRIFDMLQRGRGQDVIRVVLA